MIRFAAVLTVVLVALGLLIGGVLTNSLLLVYLSIGVAALAAVMLIVGVVIWRGDVFGDAPAGRAAAPAREVAAPAATAAGPAREAEAPAREAAGEAAATAAAAEPAGRPEALAGQAASGQAPAPEGPDRPETSQRPDLPPERPAEPAAREVPQPAEPAAREVPPVAEPAARQAPQEAAWVGFWQRAQPAAGGGGPVDDQPRERAGAERTASADEAGRANEATKAAVAAAAAALRSGGRAETAEPEQAAAAEAPPARDPAGTRGAAPAGGAPGTTAAAEPGPAETATPPGTTAASETAAPPGTTAAGTGAADSAPGGGSRRRGPDTGVIIVQGIGRYHRSGCILIRFMGPEDLESMTLRAAEEAGCVPCKACRPEQQLAGD